MSIKSKFRKLNLGPSDPVTRRNSCTGMYVVADYTDPVTSQRTLVLERPEAEPAARTMVRKARAKRVTRATTTTKPSAPAPESPALAFPPADVRSA